MSEEKFLQLNIAFRIPENVAKVAMELSREIAEKEDAYFVLDGVEYFPHITNYNIEIPEKNLEKLIEAVGKLAKEFSSVEFIFDDNIMADTGWIAPYFERTQRLKDIHEGFIGALNILRENHIREKFMKSNEFSSDEEQENVVKFGHPWVMGLYEPHLTITRLKDNDIAEKVSKELDWKIEKFQVDSIGIFVSGEHGTCRKLIKEFKFGK
jgi:2'-5' RNA ligase